MHGVFILPASKTIFFQIDFDDLDIVTKQMMWLHLGIASGEYPLCCIFNYTDGLQNLNIQRYHRYFSTTDVQRAIDARRG